MIRLALIGAGRIGQIHAANIVANKNTKLALVSDPNNSNAEIVAVRTGAKIASVSDALEDSSVDGVIIATPAASHVDLLLQAMRSGKVVFCEKPLSLDVAAAKAAVKDVKAIGARCMLGFHRRYDPQFTEARQQIANGELGSVYQIMISSRTAALPSAEYGKTSGGLFRDQSIHDLDIARYLLSEEFEKVYAIGGCLIDKSPERAGAVDTAMITMTTFTGCQVHINNGGFSPFGYDQRVEIFGTKAALFIENVAQDTVVRATAQGFAASKPVQSFIERYDAAYKAELESFLRFVKNRNEPVADETDGLRAQQLSEAAFESHRSGNPIRLERHTVGSE